jgi:Hypoxanthine-guanine phosphoribosyltransferase
LTTETIDKSPVTIAFTRDDIARRVGELATAIRADAGSTEIILVGILKGSAVFLSDLLRVIEGDVSYHFIDVVQGQTDTEVAEATQINYFTHFDIAGKNVYLLKDVVSTGVIEAYLLSQLRQRNPNDLKLVALLDRPDYRTMQLDVAFPAFRVGAGTFVGYGLEFRGKLGNLPFIGSVA